jgi:Cu(I)/Ag(I) efflux system membrane protein CusA/SilA
VGGRLVEFASREYMVRGRGYARSLDDLRSIVVGGDARSGVPITVKDIGQVTLGPDIRRGIADLDGKGDAVGGVVIMRSGENALSVIDRIKAKTGSDPTLAASRGENCFHLRPIRTHTALD